MNSVIQKKTYKEPVLFTLDNKRMVFGDCTQSGSGDADCETVGQNATDICGGQGISAGGTCVIDGMDAIYACRGGGANGPE